LGTSNPTYTASDFPPLSNITHKDGYCIMYDECATNELNNKKINCYYNGKAKKLQDEDGLDILFDLCPYLHKGMVNFYTFFTSLFCVSLCPN